MTDIQAPIERRWPSRPGTSRSASRRSSPTTTSASSCASGEILGLLGENGAGKSTLVKMLFGLYHPDEGEILIKGEAVQLRNPGDAIDRGVGMVHQHFQLVPVFTVAENIMLGAETHTGPFLDTATASQRIRELSHAVRPRPSIPTPLVEDLPVGTQQRVEILKALYRKADILILDEPTAVLTPTETDELLKVMRDLAANGASIIFITHKLREVMAVCDTIAVLRAGKVVGTTTPAGHRPGRAGQHDGRPQRRAAGREGRRPPGRRRARRAAAWRPTTTVATRPSTASTCRCGPARSSASPASRATASASSSRRCAACGR